MLIRKAKPDDVEAIFELMQDLARHENVLEYFTCKKQNLKEFLKQNFIKALLLEHDDKIIGLALFYLIFTGLSAKKAAKLEVFFIKKEYRKKGFAKALFKALNEECLKKDYESLEFICVNSNKKGLDFYELGCGLKASSYDYKTFILEKDDMQKMLELT